MLSMRGKRFRRSLLAMTLGALLFPLHGQALTLEFAGLEGLVGMCPPWMH